MHFVDRLMKKIEKSSPICVGLDPRYDQLPQSIIDQAPTSGAALLEFNKGIIDAVHDLVPAVKLQMAFYEMFGLDGMAAFARTIEYAKSKDLLVIADGKRNDIGTSAEAYANAYLDSVGDFCVDALTVNAYLGYDGIKPFIEKAKKHEKGIFILVRTSNLSAGDIQDRNVDQEKIPLFELMARYVDSWGQDLIGTSGYSSIGAVVAARVPTQVKTLRELMPHTFFLVPGYGAQGARGNDIKACFDQHGKGAIINNSRGIIFAYQTLSGFGPESYQEASRTAVLSMKNDIQHSQEKSAIMNKANAVL